MTTLALERLSTRGCMHKSEGIVKLARPVPQGPRSGLYIYSNSSSHAVYLDLCVWLRVSVGGCLHSPIRPSLLSNRIMFSDVFVLQLETGRTGVAHGGVVTAHLSVQ